MNEIDDTDWIWVGDQQTNEHVAATEDSGTSRRSFLRGGVGAGIATAVGMMSSVTAASGTGERDVLFTGNRIDGTLSLNDAHTYERLGTVNTVPDADNEPDAVTQEISYPLVNALGGGKNFVQDIDISPDGRTVYVSRGHLADVVAIDIETNELLWETEVDGFRADHQTISEDGRFLYTSAITSDAIHMIDTEQGNRVDTVEVTTYPHGNQLHELPGLGGGATLVNGSLGNMITSDAYNDDIMDHRLTFMDPTSLEILRTFNFEEGVRPFVFSSDGRKAYVQISYLHGFHEYDVVEDQITRTKHLPKTAHVPENKRDYPLQSAHHGIDISADGEYLCIAGTTSWYAAIVRRSDLKLVNTIPVGKYPYWVETAPDGEHAFVAVKAEDTVSVINYKDATEVARIPVGNAPMVMEHQSVPESVLESKDQPATPKQNTLRIKGSGGYSFYSFNVTSDVNGQSTTQEDTVKGSTVSGAVGPGADVYTFTGSLKMLYVAPDASVYLNGDEINPDNYESMVTIKGDGSYTSYSFTVMNGTITDTDSLSSEDTVNNNYAKGAVEPGSETYTFTGVFQSFKLDGSATVVLNDQPVDPARF